MNGAIKAGSPTVTLSASEGGTVRRIGVRDLAAQFEGGGRSAATAAASQVERLVPRPIARSPTDTYQPAASTSARIFTPAVRSAVEAAESTAATRRLQALAGRLASCLNTNDPASAVADGRRGAALFKDADGDVLAECEAKCEQILARCAAFESERAALLERTRQAEEREDKIADHVLALESQLAAAPPPPPSSAVTAADYASLLEQLRIRTEQLDEARLQLKHKDAEICELRHEVLMAPIDGAESVERQTRSVSDSSLPRGLSYGRLSPSVSEMRQGLSPELSRQLSPESRRNATLQDRVAKLEEELRSASERHEASQAQSRRELMTATATLHQRDEYIAILVAKLSENGGNGSADVVQRLAVARDSVLQHQEALQKAAAENSQLRQQVAWLEAERESLLSQTAPLALHATTSPHPAIDASGFDVSESVSSNRAKHLQEENSLLVEQLRDADDDCLRLLAEVDSLRDRLSRAGLSSTSSVENDR